MKFFVVRVYFNQEGKQSNSIQCYTEMPSAQKRFYSIIATDIDNDSVVYEMVQIVNGDGITLESYIIEHPVIEPDAPEEA